MCTVLLPPGDNPTAVNKHININIYHTLSDVVGFLAPGASDHRNSELHNCHNYRLFQITNLMHNAFILQQYVCYTTILNMFRAARCSSSGGRIVLPQPLVSSPSVNSRTVCRWRADCSLYSCLQRVTIPEAVVIQFVFLRTSSVLLETC